MIRLSAIAAISILGGCVSLLPEQPPAPRLFVLEAGQVAPASGAPLDAVVGVSAPGGERAILGSDLVWRQGSELAYVARAQWSGRAQDSLQSLLVETLSRQGRVRAATRLGETRTDYDLRWDLVDFEIVERGDGIVARFVADAKVLRATTRDVLGARMVEVEIPVSDRSASEASQALTRAAQEGGARIGVFTAETIESAQSSAASITR
jgi:ABC-type uncharacterized transport system auxiliary subunit